MHRMADDIIILRSQVSSLESENSQLRRDLSLHQDLGHTMLDDIDVDVMTRAEIADRIGIIPHIVILFKHAQRRLRSSLCTLMVNIGYLRTNHG